MPPRITKHNWSQSVDAALEAVLQAAATYPPGCAQEQALVYEATRLRHLREIVRNIAPESREAQSSPLIAISVREGLVFPSELLEQVGAVYNVYRRWRRDLT